MAQIPAIDMVDVFHEVEASGCFGNSKQLIKLLRYLLNYNASENDLPIKQYSIAVDVFGRDEQFDPSEDSIVRVEMHRLRASLTRFNSLNKKYMILLPVGSYNIRVEQAGENSSKEVEVIQNQRLFSMLLALWHFLREMKGRHAIIAIIAVCISYMVSRPDAYIPVEDCSNLVPNVSILTQRKESELVNYSSSLVASVIAQHTSVSLVDDATKCKGLTASFIIEIGAFEGHTPSRVVINTYHGRRTNIIDFANIANTEDNLLDIENFNNEIIRSTVDLVKPYGIIPRYAASVDWSSPNRKASYSCLIDMYDSYSMESKESYSEHLACLEKAHENGIASLDNIGSLATAYLTQYAGYEPYSVKYPLLRAKALIEEVGDDWVNSSEMIIAKLIYESERPDYYPDQLRLVLSVAEKHYNNNPHVMLTAAIRAGYKLGDWDYAKRLSDRVKQIHSERDSSVFAVDAAYALLFASPSETMRECLKTYSSRALINNILVNACAVKANDKPWERQTRQNLTEIKSDAQVKDFIIARNYEPNLTQLLVASASKETTY